jgi:biotin carboxyl carrier protein
MRWLLAVGLLALGCPSPPAVVEPAVTPTAGGAAVRWARATAARGSFRWEVPAVARVDGLGAGVVTAAVRVRVVTVRAMPGDRVEAGQSLADVEAPEVLRALGNRDAATVRLAPLRVWRAELQSQRDAGLVRLSELRDVEARLADAEASLRIAEAELRASGFTPSDLDTLRRTGRAPLRAPVAGVVRSVAMVAGRVVDPGEAPLASIAGARPPRVELRLHEPWPEGASLRFEPLSGPAVALDATPLSETVDPDTGARLLWLRPQGDASLVAGTAGRVVVSGLPEDAVEIPARALVRREGEARVLVRQGDTARPQAVRVLSVTAHTALVRGLPPGAEVVAEADRPEAR